jgi:hypothetical protein
MRAKRHGARIKDEEKEELEMVVMAKRQRLELLSHVSLLNLCMAKIAQEVPLESLRDWMSQAPFDVRATFASYDGLSTAAKVFLKLEEPDSKLVTGVMNSLLMICLAKERSRILLPLFENDGCLKKFFLDYRSRSSEKHNTCQVQWKESKVF